MGNFKVSKLLKISLTIQYENYCVIKKNTHTKQQNVSRPINIENRVVGAWGQGDWRMDEIGKGD